MNQTVVSLSKLYLMTECELSPFDQFILKFDFNCVIAIPFIRERKGADYDKYCPLMSFGERKGDGTMRFIAKYRGTFNTEEVKEFCQNMQDQLKDYFFGSLQIIFKCTKDKYRSGTKTKIKQSLSFPTVSASHGFDLILSDFI